MSKKKKAHGTNPSIITILWFFIRWIGNCLLGIWDFISWLLHSDNRSRITNASNGFDAWFLRTFGASLDPWIKFLSLGIIVVLVVKFVPALYFNYIAQFIGGIIGIRALVHTIRPPSH